MPVDGIYRNTPERKALFEAKSHDHGNRTIREDRFLGVTVDEQLKWQTYINKRCKTVTRFFFLLVLKVNPITSREAHLAFFFTYIMSHITYVSNVWDEMNSSVQRNTFFFVFHKRTVKLLMAFPNMDHKLKCCALKLSELDKYHSTNVF